VLDVDAAPLKRALVVVAISYYPFDCCLLNYPITTITTPAAPVWLV
jgi:hypothetical protein